MRTKASHIAFFIDSTHHFISAIPILYSSSSMHIHFSNQFSKYTALILLRKRPRETTIIIKTVGKCPSNCLARFPACKVNVGQRTVLALVLMLYPLRTHESQISQSEINLKRSRNVKKKNSNDVHCLLGYGVHLHSVTSLSSSPRGARVIFFWLSAAMSGDQFSL